MRNLIPSKKTTPNKEEVLPYTNNINEINKNRNIHHLINIMVPVFILKIKLFNSKQAKYYIDKDIDHLHKDITIIINNFNFISRKNLSNCTELLFSLKTLQIVHQMQYSKSHDLKEHRCEQNLIEVKHSNDSLNNINSNFIIEKIDPSSSISKSELSQNFAYLLIFQDNSKRTQTIDVSLGKTVFGLDHELVSYINHYFTSANMFLKTFYKELTSFYIIPEDQDQSHPVETLNKSFKLEGFNLNVSDFKIFAILNREKFLTITLKDIKLDYSHKNQSKKKFTVT